MRFCEEDTMNNENMRAIEAAKIMTPPQSKVLPSIDSQLD
jgi:hypothetical protein